MLLTCATAPTTTLPSPQLARPHLNMFCDASTFGFSETPVPQDVPCSCFQPGFCNSLLTGRAAVDNLCVPEGYMTAPRTTAHAIPENAACTCTLAEVNISLLWQIWHVETHDTYLHRTASQSDINCRREQRSNYAFSVGLPLSWKCTKAVIIHERQTVSISRGHSMSSCAKFRTSTRRSATLDDPHYPNV